MGGANASYGDPAGTDGNMWINQAEKNGLSGFDDDSNGFIDDWIGWDFYSDDNDPRDQNGHGTHLAGIIAAGTNDGYGSSGVAGGWQSGILSAEGNGVKIMALRVGDSQVNMALAAQAFYYATINGAKIINCSWPSDNSGNLDDAIAYFLANGGIIFKSAGNNNSQVPDYINGLENGAVISVAATDSLDRKANFSNYGMWVDISAPGTKIVSTYHDNQAPDTDFWSTKSGTSMASPMTAAVAALIWSHWPQWDGGQVVSWLKESCVDNIRPYLELQHSLKMGSGRINASKVKCPNDIPEEWTQTYAINISDIAVDIFQTSAGEYITLINSNDVDETIANNFNINLQKVNAYGCLEWSKSLEYSSTIDLIARQFIPTSDGGYLIVGDYGTQPDDKDIIVIKADSDGNKIWKRTYGGAYQQSGTDILETLNGDFLITGTCGNSSGDNDVLIMKIDGDNGDSLQAVRYGVYGATTAEEGQRILNAHSGGYIVMASANNESAYFLWLDDNLDTTKTVLYSVTGKYLYIKSMELTSDLGYICIGYTMQYDYPPNPAEYDIFMFKIDSDGETCWSQSYGQQGDDDRAYGVRETSEGGFIIAGEIEVSGQYEKDVILYKTNACGNLHWEQILYESGDEYPLGIIQTSENGFAFCGSNRVPYDTYGHSYIVKIPEQPSYPCGEVNGIDPISILDIIFIINYKYKGGPAPDPVNRADIDCDGDVDILDVIYLQEFKYKNGPAPCPCRL